MNEDSRGRRQRETNNKTPYTHRPLLGPPDSIIAFDWLLNSYSSKTVIKHAAYSERMMLATDISDLVEMLPFSICSSSKPLQDDHVTLRPNTPHSGTEENPTSSWEFDVTADMYAPAWSEGAAI